MAEHLQPADPGFRERLAELVASQPLMKWMGIELVDARPGDVTVALAHTDTLRQSHGYLHGGVSALLADEACGLTALSLVRDTQSVVTSDLSVSFLRPGVGVRYEARAYVVRPGRNLTSCRCDVHAIAEDGSRKLIAIAQASLMNLDRR